MIRRPYVKDLILIILIMVFGIVFYNCSHWITGLSGDGGDGHYAVWAANAKILHDGEVPLWNPYIWGGYADVGHIHEVFYPILIALEYIFWNSTTQTLSYSIFPAYISIHLVIGGLGMYALGRTRKKSPLVSFLVAELITFSGCFTYGVTWAYIFGSYCWIIWLILFLYLLVQKRKKVWIVMSSIVLGMIGLCASAQGCLFAVLIYVIMYGCAVWNKRKSWKECIKLTNEFLLSGFLGMSLAATELIPFIETSINAFRYVPGLDLLESEGRIPLAIFKEDIAASNAIMGIFGDYRGVLSISFLVLGFVIIAFFIKDKKSDLLKNFSIVLMIGSFMYTIGVGIVDIFWYIPGFNAIREPILYAPFVAISAGILSFDSVEVIVNVLNKNMSGRWKDYLANYHVCNGLLLFVAVIIFLPHQIRGVLDVMAKILVIVIVLLLVLHRKINNIIINFFMLGIILLNVCQFVQSNTSNDFYSPKDATDKINNVNELAKILIDELDDKVADGGDPTARYLIWSPTGVLPSNVAGVNGDKDCFAYLNPISQKNYFVYQMVDIVKKIELQNIKYILLGNDNEETFIEWLENSIGKKSELAETIVYDTYDSTETKEIRYIDVSDLNLGCGWVVNDVQYYSGSEEAGDFASVQNFLTRINDISFDLGKTVLIDAETVQEQQEWDVDNNVNIVSSVECIEYNVNNIKYKVNSDRNGVLVTSEFYYPGWHVKIDGKQADILQVDYGFRGVYITDGQHIVEYYYFPASLWIGIILTIIAFLYIIIFLLQYRKENRKCV